MCLQLMQRVLTTSIWVPSQSHLWSPVLGVRALWGCREEHDRACQLGDKQPQQICLFRAAPLNHSVVSDSLQPHGLQPARLFCPQDFPGKNTGVGSHCFLQGIFPTQGSNLGLLHHRRILYQLSHQGSPSNSKVAQNRGTLAIKQFMVTHCLGISVLISFVKLTIIL